MKKNLKIALLAFLGVIFIAASALGINALNHNTFSARIISLCENGSSAVVQSLSSRGYHENGLYFINVDDLDVAVGDTVRVRFSGMIQLTLPAQLPNHSVSLRRRGNYSTFEGTVTQANSWDATSDIVVYVNGETKTFTQNNFWVINASVGDQIKVTYAPARDDFEVVGITMLERANPSDINNRSLDHYFVAKVVSQCENGSTTVVQALPNQEYHSNALYFVNAVGLDVSVGDTVQVWYGDIILHSLPAQLPNHFVAIQHRGGYPTFDGIVVYEPVWGDSADPLIDIIIDVNGEIKSLPQNNFWVINVSAGDQIRVTYDPSDGGFEVIGVTMLERANAPDDFDYSSLDHYFYARVANVRENCCMIIHPIATDTNAHLEGNVRIGAYGRHASVGDVVKIYFNGLFLLSYPAQLDDHIFILHSRGGYPTFEAEVVEVTDYNITVSEDGSPITFSRDRFSWLVLSPGDVVSVAYDPSEDDFEVVGITLLEQEG